MNSAVEQSEPTRQPDSGLRALCGIAAYFRIPANPDYIYRELGLRHPATADDLLLAGKLLRLKVRRVPIKKAQRLRTAPSPSIVELRKGGFIVFGGLLPSGRIRVVDPVMQAERQLHLSELFDEIEPYIILVARRFGGPGAIPKPFGINWFIPSIWKYRRPLGHVLATSVVLQIFALVTPLLFQIIIDKVLSHQSYDTLYLVIMGLVAFSVFETLLQYLRAYALSHTTNRIDVELGRRLFHHLLRLPLGYFESNAAGQTVARVRELENVRAFLTGQALFSMLDFVFAFILLAVLFVYSVKLTLIVIATIPLYILVAAVLRPPLRERIREKFNTGAESQQFLVESVVGIQTLKAAAVEPSIRVLWEEKLAAYVKTSFRANILASLGQNAIQMISKLSTAIFLLFGAQAVMDGDLTIGALIAFNMISAQVMQPVLRLSQLWQDFQQVQISMDRLGDILNRPVEPGGSNVGVLPRPTGRISIRNVTFRYRSNGADILKNVSLEINPGEVIGIVGPSGSGKSTLTKLIQRLYVPSEGQVLVDGVDVMHCDVSWLRSNVSVVLQENLLFNRTVHENIALANPAIARQYVINVARLAGADEFISKMELGYDTVIEERGTNLSGGQRQRIAIARALITNPPIIIFDEATSALDYESERVIRENMSRIAQGRTVIIIAHRLAAVRHCHKIIGVKDGEIVESGTHEELLQRPDGLYAYLWNLQSGQAQS